MSVKYRFKINGEERNIDAFYVDIAKITEEFHDFSVTANIPEPTTCFIITTYNTSSSSSSTNVQKIMKCIEGGTENVPNQEMYFNEITTEDKAKEKFFKKMETTPEQFSNFCLSTFVGNFENGLFKGNINRKKSTECYFNEYSPYIEIGRSVFHYLNYSFILSEYLPPKNEYFLYGGVPSGLNYDNYAMHFSYSGQIYRITNRNKGDVYNGYYSGAENFYNAHSMVYSEFNNEIYVGFLASTINTEGYIQGISLFLIPEKNLGVSPLEPTHGPSSEGGGGFNGTFDNSSIDINITPNFGNIISNFFVGDIEGAHLYFMDATQYNRMISSFYQTLLKDGFAGFKNYAFSPWESVVTAHLIPFTPALAGVTAQVRANGLPLTIDGVAVTSDIITNPQKDFVVGEINIDYYYDSYLDFQPYTDISIYLPFIGTHKLDTNKCMGGKIKVIYRFDALNGNCCASIILTDRFGHTSLINQLNGNCAIQMPISGSSGRTGAVLGALPSFASGMINGNPAQVASAAYSVLTSQQKTDYVNYNGSVASLGCLQTYIIINRPCSAVPSNVVSFRGTPSETTAKIGKCKGFLQVENVHVAIPRATDAEKEMIENSLKNGIII